MKPSIVLSACLVLGACGLADTASTTAAVAEGKAREAQAARETQEQLVRQLDQAEAQARRRLQEAEEAK